MEELARERECERLAQQEARDAELAAARDQLAVLQADAERIHAEVQQAQHRLKKEEETLKRRSLDVDRTIGRFLNKQVDSIYSSFMFTLFMLTSFMLTQLLLNVFINIYNELSVFQ